MILSSSSPKKIDRGKTRSSSVAVARARRCQNSFLVCSLEIVFLKTTNIGLQNFIDEIHPRAAIDHFFRSLPLHKPLSIISDPAILLRQITENIAGAIFLPRRRVRAFQKKKKKKKKTATRTSKPFSNKVKVFCCFVFFMNS